MTWTRREVNDERLADEREWCNRGREGGRENMLVCSVMCVVL